MRDLAELTWEEVRDLDRARTVALLPVGAVEAHGPHLPIGTDLVIALGMARSAGATLETRGRACVLLPPLTYTAAPFAAAFPGTLSVSPATVTALVLDLARELTRHGFAALGIANAHLDPAHRAALADAVGAARDERLLPLACPDLTRRAASERLTEEFRGGACHAGRFEGSIVLAERPELVREAIRITLAPNPVSLSAAIQAGHDTFAAAGGPRAYFGWPADATAEEGRATLATLGAILADGIDAVLVVERRT
ncbi:MAG: creatininase family protein [Candidatus Eisenbacteria bacterium]